MSSVSVSKNKAKTFVWASLNILVNISVTRLNSVALSKRASRKYICNPMRPSFRSAQWVLAQFAMISPMSWTAGSQCNLSLESVHKPYWKEKKRGEDTVFLFSGCKFLKLTSLVRRTKSVDFSEQMLEVSLSSDPSSKGALTLRFLGELFCKKIRKIASR